MFYLIIKNNRVTKVVREDEYNKEGFRQALDRCKESRECLGITYELVEGHMEMLADYAVRQQEAVAKAAILAAHINDFATDILDTAESCEDED